jgi:transcriptional regulator with GAF, ATPase, and Fis domain
MPSSAPSDQLVANLLERLCLGPSFADAFAALDAGLRVAVPFDRIAVGLLDEAGECLRLAALRSDGEPALKVGYSDPIAGSTLEALLQSGRPRIINDLPAYLTTKPSSRSTRLMVREGMRANLSVPLLVAGHPFGFLFLSSRSVGAYCEAHAQMLARLAGPMAAVLDRTRLTDEMGQQTARTRPAAPTMSAAQSAFDLLTSLPGLDDVCRAIDRVAATDASVLIVGETGTGKELVAQAVHERSARSAGPLVTINCSALPRELIAAELFGHEAGAFTGANSRRVGRFEFADGGTLFLDEIGELALDAQVLLLRALQVRRIDRIGGNEAIPVDIRIIAATNRDLATACRTGAFRPDLFYRLNVFPIVVPALRERHGDIPLLLERFLSRCAERLGKPRSHVPSVTLDRLVAHHWPGNVRELDNLVERAVIASEGANLEIDPRWFTSSPVARFAVPDLRSWADREREAIHAALRSCGGKVYGPGGAAELLKLKPTTLYGKMRKLGIRRGDVHRPHSVE